MNILPALINELFAILCEEEEEAEDDEEHTVSSMASQVRNFYSQDLSYNYFKIKFVICFIQVFSLMALYLPPEKFIPPLVRNYF